MPAKPDRTHPQEWLQSRIMSELEQAIHRQGIDPQDVPCAWKVLKGLEERIAQQGVPGVIDSQFTLSPGWPKEGWKAMRCINHRSEACSPQMMQGVSGDMDHKGFRT
jgi:hypothetical protein